MRLVKFLALAGLASRRKAADLVKQGKVQINGRLVLDLSYQVDPEKDQVLVEGKEVKLPPKVYYLFYKPRGYLTSLYDPHHRKTIAEFLRKLPYRVFPVGRLDKDSEGLLLLTNDGDLANLLLHPKFEVVRTYHVWVDKAFSSSQIEKVLKEGVEVEGKIVKPLNFKLIKKDNRYFVYEVKLKEGRKREVRRIVKSMSRNVKRLLRVGYGPLTLGNLKPGEIVELKGKEFEKLLSFVAQIKNSKTLAKTSSGEST
ncbi:MAG: rRNA pseudouridine synthase [Thermodesulfobacterium sp.]|jgi:23S rRNA pseudouridine2605 synthase|nr:rRNA pseudouridine synthase [Thermodesulfobacterium sp.]